jgi:hypothetical protein
LLVSYPEGKGGGGGAALEGGKGAGGTESEIECKILTILVPSPASDMSNIRVDDHRSTLSLASATFVI